MVNNGHVWFLDKSLLQLISLATSCFTKAIEIISLHVASHVVHFYWTVLMCTKRNFPSCWSCDSSFLDIQPFLTEYF